MSSPATTELRVNGMTCSHCARKVTTAAQNIPGVHSVTVRLEAKRASVRWNPAAEKNVPAVLAAIAQAGYAAREISPDQTGGLEADPGRWQWNLLSGLAVTAVLMVGEWILGLAMVPWFQWFAFALAGGIQIFCGAQFYRGAWRQIKVGQSNMDALVALGSTTAFGYSTWALFSGAGGHVYFMEAAAIISLISAGHWLEARVSDRASGALKSLLNLAPPTARKVQSPNSELQSPAGQPFNLKTLSFSNSAIRNPQSAMEKIAAFAALRERALACVKCPHLASSRKHVVFGVGSIDAQLMFVGEAPGADEDEQGEPFVGKAGQLLTKIIQATGLTRADVYIANILKCRPDTPGQSAGNRKPTPEEMQTCIPFLHEQIDLIRPKVIVALGATAVEGLLGKTAGITKLRGNWQTYRGTPLMPTYHPAYLLRNQAMSEKRRVWEDMLAAMEKLAMPISEKQRNYFLKA
jgi:DNA polymerase